MKKMKKANRTTDRERECSRLLSDALGAAERLQRIVETAYGYGEFSDHLSIGADETLRVLRGKIEDAEALVRRWGE